MPENTQESKLQIRARILSSIVNLLSNFKDRDYIGNEIDELKKIQNKDAILEILIKEFFKENIDSRDYVISFLIQSLIEKEKVEKTFFEYLVNPKINDSLKAKIVGFLREIGKYVNYEQYINYFENPDEIIDSDTQKLLENAKINPEAQIDFLDFMSALPQNEKEMLINSLSEDYDGDELTNILIPVILSNPYSEISQKAIQSIGESKSKLAYPVLVWLNDNIDDLKVKSNVQKSLNLLKISGIKEDITKDYYKRILTSSPVYKCYISFPDGHGNVGIIFSRTYESGFIQMFALVQNDTDGIIDCFGFNEISEEEFERIVTKFYQNNKVIETNAEFCKYLIENAEKITRLKYDSVSYEYIAWKSIMKDIDLIQIDLKAGLNIIELNDILLKQLYNNNYFDKWFFEYNDNDSFAQMTDEIFENKISDTKEFENYIKKYKNNIFNQTQIDFINNRLLMSAYLAKLDEENIESSALYSLINESGVKEEFLTNYVKLSLYQYFLLQKDRYNSLKNATSIFARKTNKELQEIDIKYVETCIKNIEKQWT